MSTFLTASGLLARAASSHCDAAPGDAVLVSHVGRFGRSVEATRLGQFGQLEGYTSGVGFAIVRFPDLKSPLLLLPGCLRRVVQ